MASELTHIRKKRAMVHYVDAAKEIIASSGLQDLTIRSVSEKAGFYSASLYRYFENLDELIAFAMIDLTFDYRRSHAEIVKNNTDSLDVFILTWRVFCEYAYANPSMFDYVYSSENADYISSKMGAYYEYFPEKCEEFSVRYRNIVLKPTNFEQDRYLVELCVEDGYFRSEDVEKILEVSMMFYEGLLLRSLHNRESLSPNDYVKKFMEHFLGFLNSILQKKVDLSVYLKA